MRRWLAGVFAATMMLALVPLTGGAAAAAPGPAAAPGVIPGSYIVVLDSDRPGSRNPGAVAAEHSRAHDASVGHVYREALRGYAARMSAQAAARVAADPRVDYVDADRVVTTVHHQCGHVTPKGAGDCDETSPEEPTESDQTTPWGITRVGAPLANTGSGISVYVIDSGIDPRHRDLDVDGGHAVERCRGGGCAADWDDDHGHGTHVAGTIGALDNDVDVVGVAPGVDLYAVKVLTKNGSGSRSGVIAGIDWVAGHNTGNPRVANMSLGGSGSKTGTCTSEGYEPGSSADSYHEAICKATNAGVVFAVAAGNSGVDAVRTVPAAYDDTVITASATSKSNDWPDWSNWGTVGDTWIPTASAPVALAAPGVSVESTRAGGGTTTKSGTSMAAPHVAGAAALYLGKYAAETADGYGAYADARTWLVTEAASTSTWANTSGNAHGERFLEVDGL